MRGLRRTQVDFAMVVPMCRDHHVGDSFLLRNRLGGPGACGNDREVKPAISTLFVVTVIGENPLAS